MHMRTIFRLALSLPFPTQVPLSRLMAGEGADVPRADYEALTQARGETGSGLGGVGRGEEAAS